MKKNLILMAILFALSAGNVLAMNSTNYQINADSINSGGGGSGSYYGGTGATYSVFDSIGESFIGNMAGTIFAVQEGFSPMVNYKMSLTLDSATKNLGTVTPGIPITGTTVASVTTDSWGGYELYINENNNLRHTDTVTTLASYLCAIASPCLWSGTGMGFTITAGTSIEAAWGSNPNYKYAQVPTTSTLFHTKPGYSGVVDNTTIQYKLDVPTTQKAGVYSDILTYIAIAKL
jgi:hypothetical protein